MLLATMYDRNGDRAKANEHYEKILNMNGSFAPAANNLAWNLVLLDGNLDIALRWAEKARDVEPQNPQIADTLGWVIYKRGNFAKAMELLVESSRGFENKNPEVLYHLGMAYYKGGERLKANDVLRKAVTIGRFEGFEEARTILSLVGG